MIKWFGILILATCFEFGDRDSLWSTFSQSKYRSAPDFGKTSMNRHHFNMLWGHVLWVHQPDVQGDGTIHEAHRWKLVEDFVTHFNEYCTQLFSPSDLICADESISRCYVQGGHWISLGFTMYRVERPQKPPSRFIYPISVKLTQKTMKSIFKNAK